MPEEAFALFESCGPASMAGESGPARREFPSEDREELNAQGCIPVWSAGELIAANGGSIGRGLVDPSEPARFLRKPSASSLADLCESFDSFEDGPSSLFRGLAPRTLEDVGRGVAEKDCSNDLVQDQNRTVSGAAMAAVTSNCAWS